uniref:disease resistance protein Roq1-like n=1 Tax=Erigeron canadensis TaxID=72917 RepID=UPI001CB8A77F|nr:disease resistance protein Roq1-like [Erigeron canadensis]
MASSSSLLSGSSSWKYDVFLSFRGEDTRKTFVDHLYNALGQHGILTYKDDVTLGRGDTIGPSLLKAIEESQILVIIFSENYADSSWCLDELSHIMKCRDSETGQIIFPIFYHVNPSDVRKQEGQFGKAFAKHEQSENYKKKVETWKKALVDASNIAGWEPKHVANGYEAKCIQEIVDSILGKLSSLNHGVEDEELVGMGIRVEQLKFHLRVGLGGVLMVGIWGLGGGGKTTLATSLYMELSGLFDGCCFLDNIRVESKQQNGLKNLQEKLLSAVFGIKKEVESVDIGKHTIKRMLCRRKVLIVLDDVDHIDQLKTLAGSHAWFGEGSRIIITTRDQHLLIANKVYEVCPVILLSKGEAIQLFRKHAYHENNPVEDYEKLSLLVISYVNGLPLALKILGSFLNDKNKDEWLSTLSRLKDHPEMDIVEKLKISYDGLKPVEKELFLDIACYFRGRHEKVAMEILDACGFHPCIGVKVLIQKALITVSSDGYFGMHDLVQEMGHYIVRGEHPNNPEKCSRIWRFRDIEDICSRSETEENDKIEVIHDAGYGYYYPINFIMLISNMKKLRFLEVTTSFHEGPRFLSNELRYISWNNYPACLFPEGFSPPKLAVIRMEYSLQKELWNGYKNVIPSLCRHARIIKFDLYMHQYLPSLKELQLKNATALVRTPDFGGLPCLQRLELDGCESLEEIHQSLGNNNSLVYIHVRNCGKLARFPSSIRLEKLEILKIISCGALVEFPKIEAKMDSLRELTLESVGIEVLPSSVGEYCTNLIKLVLRGCDLKDGGIPNQFGELSSLEELDLSENPFTRLNFSLSRLTSLKIIELSRCPYLVELPELPSSLFILEADYCSSLNTIIRDDIPISFKWLCHVSMWEGKKNKIGAERLIKAILQGNFVESGCMSLHLNGLEIPRVFKPCLVRGKRCRMQLLENWYNDFSGFLFYTALNYSFIPTISMKHEKPEGSSTRMKDSQDDMYLEESYEEDLGKCTWLGYISFGSLRNTLWFNQISAGIEIEFYHRLGDIYGCGFKLIPKRSETSIRDFSSFDDVYACGLNILHDSKSALECYIAISKRPWERGASSSKRHRRFGRTRNVNDVHEQNLEERITERLEGRLEERLDRFADD